MGFRYAMRHEARIANADRGAMEAQLRCESEGVMGAVDYFARARSTEHVRHEGWWDGFRGCVQRLAGVPFRDLFLARTGLTLEGGMGTPEMVRDARDACARAAETGVTVDEAAGPGGTRLGRGQKAHDGHAVPGIER